MRKYIYIGLAVVIVTVATIMLRPRPVPVEMGSPETRTVLEYITEDGTTRLGDTYTIDMPISGTLERIAWEVGDVVDKGEVVARVDTYELEQRIREIEAFIEQFRARTTSVDINKPKEEDIQSAQLRMQEMSASLAMAEKSLAATELNLEEAERAYNRAQHLRADGVVSESYLDEAETRYKSLVEERKRAELQVEASQKELQLAELAYQRLTGSIDDNEYMREEYEAQIEAFEAQLARLKRDLKKAEIVSPVAGPVLEKHYEDRRVLTAGTPLMMIGDLNSLEIESDILSEEVAAVEVGDTVVISGKAISGGELKGRVTRIYPSGFTKISALGVEQQRVKTIIAIDGDASALRPGTRVEVQVITAQSDNALAVPDRSIFRRESAWHLFAVVDGRAKLQKVEVGLRNVEWAEIRSGLEPDATIITDPKNELQDGTRVKASNVDGSGGFVATGG